MPSNMPDARAVEEALRRGDRSYRVWNILGAVSLKEGKEQEACEAFEKACSSGDCAGIYLAGGHERAA